MRYFYKLNISYFLYDKMIQASTNLLRVFSSGTNLCSHALIMLLCDVKCILKDLKMRSL